VLVVLAQLLAIKGLSDQTQCLQELQLLREAALVARLQQA
jgi:hypothetical protein